jgi:hypothetical protein
MAPDPLDYPRLLQTALRGVVREALRVVSREGLPGEHHFYLTVRTDAAGVVIPPRLRKLYPTEMTLVLQHQFWDLAVDEERFAVSLRFGGAREHLSVPFAALLAFVDPSASFGLRFDAQTAQGDAAAGPEAAATEARAEVEAGTRAPAPDPTPNRDGNVVDFREFRKGPRTGGGG